LQVFLLEPLRNASTIADLLLKTTPLVLCALGLSVCYRANIWNIGAEGQLIAGGLCRWCHDFIFRSGHTERFRRSGLLLATLAGIAGGAAWASVTALLRDRFNANEILVSLMLTCIAQLLLMYAVNGPLKDPNGMNFPQSKFFPVNFCCRICSMAVAIYRLSGDAGCQRRHGDFYLSQLLPAFALTVGGLAPLAARYAGFPVARLYGLRC
jgi:simple sugar transport system permease protein